MAKAFGFTKKPRRPIAGWMVQANPAVWDIVAAMDQLPVEDDWDWTCFPNYRVDLIDAGQPVFLWISLNDEVPSGIWVIGAATGKAYMGSGEGDDLWLDRAKGDERRPILPWRGRTLMRPVLRDDLLKHPVLKDLDVLRMPQGPNPMVLTPDHIEALHRDFDLSTGPIADDVWGDWSAASDPYVWVRGRSGREMTASELNGSWQVDLGVGSSTSHATLREAIHVLVNKLEPSPPFSSDRAGWVPLAYFADAIGNVTVYRTADERFEAWLEDAKEEVPFEPARLHTSLRDALLALERCLRGQSATPRAEPGFSLTRSGCLGRCPAYDVSIGLDGHVRYHGQAHVERLGFHEGHVEPRLVASVVRAAEALGIHMWPEPQRNGLREDLPIYTIEFADSSGYDLSIRQDGQYEEPEHFWAVAALVDTLLGQVTWSSPQRGSRSAT